MTDNQNDPLFKLRHSCAHLMAQAVVELYPNTRLAIGPPIEDGFYYDFESDHTFVPEDLEAIEAKMRQLAGRNEPFVRSEHSKTEAKDVFGKKGEKFKLELMEDIPGDTVTYYTHGAFTDLCAGPHVEKTSQLQNFKLLKISGAYWRGDEKREQLQRIYGTIWPTRKELDAYLAKQEEAKKRDHRVLGPRLKLFTMLPEEAGPGLIFWLPNGAIVRQTIEAYIRDLHRKHGYLPTYMPHISKVDLWKTSGHWDYYRENMYSPIDIEGQQYLLKPMNCPGHILIYQSDLHSYRELPLRLYELGTVYRYERSGVLHGLMRVRGFTQDDSHIFCRPDQLESEISGVLKLTQELLGAFGFKEYELKLSTRPEKYAGTLESWDRAEKALQNALQNSGLPFTVDPGEGVFYGPKIDLKIKDSIGRPWQCSTVQVDFNNPLRFNVTFRNEKGEDEHVVMVHRALLGSLERFFGILIENYGGAFPLWLAPVQAALLSITERSAPYLAEWAKKLEEHGLRVRLDNRNEKINLKVREATLDKIPYLLVAGDREVEAGTISVRTRAGETIGVMPWAALLERLDAEIQRKS